MYSGGFTRVPRRPDLKFSAGTKLKVALGSPSPSKQWPEYSKAGEQETRRHGTINFHVLKGDDSLLVKAKTHLGGPDARMPDHLSQELLELAVDGVQPFHSDDPKARLLISK